MLNKFEKFPVKITENLIYDFNISEYGVYLIEIIASCKNWKQNWRSLFNDDDLAIKIDDIEFPKLNGKNGLLNGEAAWNGNNLKGLKKTGIFILKLESGDHKIDFIPNKNPLLHSIKILKVESNIVEYIPAEENKQAEDGNNRQWMSVALADLFLKELKIAAKAEKRKKDSDDIKLIIDGEIQKNPDSKKFKNWYWSGNLDNGEEKEFNKELNFSEGLHYIELWADRMPTLNKIILNLGKEESKESQKRIPTVDDPEWTGNFDDDTEQMILARAIFGEGRSLPEKGRIAIGWVVKNRVEDSRWGDTYSSVILAKGQFSAFNEDDPNLPFIKNPFMEEDQIDDWKECYEIAGKVMNGDVEDPTDGANHYFSTFIAPPYWTKDKRAQFKIQIGNTKFYNLRKTAKESFAKLIFILIIAFILTVIFSVFLENKTARKQEAKKEEDIKTEKFKYFFINPKSEEASVIYLDENGEFLRFAQLTNDGYPKSNLEVFSDGEMFGYYKLLHKKGENYNLNDEKISEDYYANYIALMIMKNGSVNPIEVYRGDVHTSNWEWGDNKHVVVYYGCGTECLYAYKINIDNGKVESGHHVYGADEGKKNAD